MWVAVISFGYILLVLWVVLKYLYVVVYNHQAFIICSNLTGKARRVVIGPKWTWVGPLEKAVVLNLSPQTDRSILENLITSDLAISADLTFLYAYDPQLIQAADLNQLLPTISDIPETIRSEAKHILSTPISGFTTTKLLTEPKNQSKLEKRLQKKLQAKLKPYCIRLDAVQVQYHHAPTMLEAKLSARHIELNGQAQANALEKEVNILGLDGKMLKFLFWRLPPIWEHLQDYRIFKN